MEFEFEPSKSATNKEKHGVDFDEAKELRRDPARMEIPARTADEQRWLIIGAIGGKVHSAVVTFRQGSIRIISVRRSRQEEVALYEG